MHTEKNWNIKNKMAAILGLWDNMPTFNTYAHVTCI